MTKKERARRLTYEALVILGVLALLLYLCRLWPLLLLTLLGIFLAAARLLETGAYDLILLDVKQADPERHLALTERDNAQTLRTAAWLEEHGKPFWLRYVLVPGYSDAEADIRTLGGRLGGYRQIERVELLPYHTLGVHKYEAMGKEYKLSDVRENTPEQLDRAAALLREYFANVVVN